MASRPHPVPLEQDGSADYALPARRRVAPPRRGRVATALAHLARRVRRYARA